jgi:succinate-semialdehyde dehydrogenase / glutarate-semialdehyde dehydrogenase
MILCRQETFGPVVSVSTFSTPDEAVARANDTDYGLNSSIISRDTKAARRLAARLRTGTVNINEGYAAAWGSVASSMGGFSDSGIGRRHGEEGLLKYVETQTVATQRVLGFGAPRGMSDKQWGDSLTGIVQAMTKLGMK